MIGPHVVPEVGADEGQRLRDSGQSNAAVVIVMGTDPSAFKGVQGIAVIALRKRQHARLSFGKGTVQAAERREVQPLECLLSAGQFTDGLLREREFNARLQATAPSGLKR